MIVPGMNPKEAANDARQDLRSLCNKLTPLSKTQEHEHRIDRKRLDVVESLVDWRSPRGNNWLVVLSTNKKGTNVAAHVWYRGKDDRLRLLRVDILNNAYDVYFSAHLLERYNERFDPSRDPIARLKDFVRTNHNLAISGTKDLGEGRQEVMCGMVQGNATGRYDPAEKMMHLTTFLSHGQLAQEQLDFTELLDFQRMMGWLSTGQKTFLLRGAEKLLDQQQAAGKANDKDQVLNLLYQVCGLQRPVAKRL
jgi:hypothetical protein